jgi:hypothetical protein
MEIALSPCLVAGLFCLMAGAMLLAACQQAAPTAVNGTVAVEQNAGAERHCCHRASRGGNH